MASKLKRSKHENKDASSSDEFEYSDEEGAVRVEGIYIPPPPVPYCSIENKGPRLIISHITNNFFKSYASNEVLGPFNKSFNGVIGPNGSGKSNVIDSMLFVFGYRANKIRSKKLSVLLHNSRQFRDVQSCTVTVHFKEIIDKGDEEFEDVPNSAFSISRTALKDNSSFYTIKNRRTHFKEVAALLMKHGIDLKHNRFLILQGEVEQISMMPAKGTKDNSGMLEYLEDIIGTLRYKEPLDKLLHKVEEYTRLRIEKINRLKIVQDEVEVLRKPMEEAVEFLKLENQIAVKKNLVYQYNIFAVRENAKELVENKQEIDKTFDEINAKIAEKNNEKVQSESKLKEMNKTCNMMEKRRDSMKGAYDAAYKQDMQLVEEIKQMNKKRHKIKAQLDAEKKNVDKLKLNPGEMEKKVHECEAAIEKLQPKVDELQKEKAAHLATMKDSTKDLQLKKEERTAKLSKLRAKVGECKSAFSLAENELKQYTSNEDNKKCKLAQLESIRDEGATKIEQLSKESNKLTTLIPSQEKKLTNAARELQEIKKREADGITKYRSIRAKVEELKMNMQSSRSKSRVVDALMHQKREGNCPGIYGRLGDLGAIDLKYDVAISTACGPLDNIVVDTVETGEWCIDYMKTNNIGRATIIVLDKLHYLEHLCKKTIKTPENVPRLYDLISIPDERIRPAFYFALRDTLVANDLTQGSRVAYGAQRFRVVTLRGELIETTGAMSGGGGRTLRGRMGQSVQKEIDPQEIVAMEREMQSENNDLQELRLKQDELERFVAQTTPEVNQMKIALEKINTELQGLKRHQPEVAASIAALKSKRVSLDASKVHKLEKDRNAKKAVYDAAQMDADEEQKQVDEITKEITEKTQGKVIAIDEQLNELNGNVEKLKTEINRLKTESKTSARSLEKAQRNIVTLEDEIKTAESKMIVMKEERDQIEADANKLLKLVEEITMKIEDEQSNFEGIKQCIKVLAKAENALKSQSIEIEQRRQTMQDELNEVEFKIKGLQSKIANLKYQEIPDQPIEQFKQFSEEELSDIDMEAATRQLQGLEVQLKALKPNLGALDEFRKKMRVVINRSAELDEVVAKWQKMRDHYDNLRGRRKDEFLEGFKIIKCKLKEMYQMITIGGDADFELIDTYDPFSDGIQFRVRPPKKTWKVISNLSGGEKTLSSLALVFALHYYKPSPLYVMDEIDAALDFKNVSIIANYVKERTKNAQFIIISLRPQMFELARHLIGIYKTYDCTKSVTIVPSTNEEIFATDEEKENCGSGDLFASQESLPITTIHESSSLRNGTLNGSSTAGNPPASHQSDVVMSQEDIFASAESTHDTTLTPSQDLFDGNDSANGVEAMEVEAENSD